MEGKPCVIEKNHCQTMKGSNMNKICQELHMYIYIYYGHDKCRPWFGLEAQYSTQVSMKTVYCSPVLSFAGNALSQGIH